MQANFNTITFSLPNVRNEEVLNAIVTGLMTIIANQFNNGDEMSCVFNRDIAYYSMGEVITDNVMDEQQFQSLHQQAVSGLEHILTHQLTTLEMLVSTSDGLSDIIPYVSPGVILLYIREGLVSNINGTYASIESNNQAYFEYCQIVGDKPSNSFLTNGDFSEII
ncbi:hypothetical protein PS2_0072 [Aeromonas phage PS2]|uniref:Uncharacterized protein n=1 Tax=Aeromonas phage PS1 TaxID=2591406 RepID=A0A514TV12_9CAUD|nr:hypothetical protein PQC64_gp189 [Aeromonas phage PS1]QDJ96833.1 hypothetical protein PS1_0074 [Aeromonas phage PS1]QFR59463.1 hypothetical protein PS2_0072 [Aeromonas phage PS2]